MMLTILALSLGLTLAFELGFALVWGLRSSRELLLVALVNCLTNPPVVLLYHSLQGQLPPLPLTAALECAAVLTEALCYHACSEKLNRPFLFSLLCNSFSYCSGFLINQLAFLM